MSCTPSYTYRPNFTSGSNKCIAPWFVEHRSRLTEDQAFFRTIKQGPETNYVELWLTSSLLSVYFESVLVETFSASTGAGSIAALRSAVENPITGSNYIEMPTLGYDIFDPRSSEDDGPTGGLTPFSRTYMRGGSGPPTTDAGLAGIRTGPERSLIILATTENDQGSPITPPWYSRVQQWNGAAWVTYSNLVAGACPYEGTD